MATQFKLKREMIMQNRIIRLRLEIQKKIIKLGAIYKIYITINKNNLSITPFQKQIYITIIVN